MERIRHEQQLLLQLCTKRNRATVWVTSLFELRDQICVSNELTLRKLEAFRLMDPGHTGLGETQVLRDYLETLPGVHDIEGIIFWIGDGKPVERFTFQQFSDAFVPHEELDVLQQMELIKQRKWELLVLLEHCHNMAINLVENPWKKGFRTWQSAFGLCRWLFEAKSHQLPKMPKDGDEASLPDTLLYRTHINKLIAHAKHYACYG